MRIDQEERRMRISARNLVHEHIEAFGEIRMNDPEVLKTDQRHPGFLQMFYEIACGMASDTGMEIVLAWQT